MDRNDHASQRLIVARIGAGLPPSDVRDTAISDPGYAVQYCLPLLGINSALSLAL